MIRIANASGFYGDRFSAVREMLTGGPIDVLTGDYLAELTMLILGRDRMKDPSTGYAKTFLRQMEEGLGLALDGGVAIVTNAGGLNPSGLAERLHALAGRLGLAPRIAVVDGDDLLPRAADLGLPPALTANAYLGGWGIAEALRQGADVVVTGRVSDASLVVGPAAARFGWARDAFDELAGAVAAGHVIECGAQATGGNYAFFTEHDVARPGFPIAEIHPDGSSVITKHPGTGGVVTVETVTAQLLYEIGGPRYANPDVTLRLDSIRLHQDGPDRVRMDGVRGEPPPATLKAGLSVLGGFRNDVTFVLTGLGIEAKAALVQAQLEQALQGNLPKEIVWTLARTDQPDAPTQEQASALLHVSVKDTDPAVVGRAFSGAAVELGLASYPGFTLTGPPGDAIPFGVFHAVPVDAAEVEHRVTLPDGSTVAIAHTAPTRPLPDEPSVSIADPASVADGPQTRPLGEIIGARSGDKGGTANIGVWARSDTAYAWLRQWLTVERFCALLPEATGLPIRRHELPDLRALNFVVDRLLGDGVSAGTRFDPQGKGLGEWLRSRHVDMPEEVR
jgi:Acyclic terpene utilisation family protein AtuA